MLKQFAILPGSLHPILAVILGGEESGLLDGLGTAVGVFGILIMDSEDTYFEHTPVDLQNALTTKAGESKQVFFAAAALTSNYLLVHELLNVPRMVMGREQLGVSIPGGRRAATYLTSFTSVSGSFGKSHHKIQVLLV
jgi:hypothetical protein